MPISAGTHLGPYEILAPLGAGGMGEVYRARDPRMGREVAIKIAAEQFTERFSREVRAVAALNHPNICHLYDVGPNYLVMELVEGPTLAERIALGAVPVEESLNIARQIAAALEAAHEKGIVHRDLKPANVKVKSDGVVKVLDFGLAKIADPPDTASRTENSPTLTIDAAATGIGVILGTVAYMPPEQARGKSVDKRADIWAFGVVLYEMLTGRRLFDGETVSDTLIEVATKEPDWTRVPPKTQRLLRKCLEKDPKNRLRDIGDAWELLEEPPVAVLQRVQAKGLLQKWLWPAATLAAALIAAVALWGWLKPSPPQPITRFAVTIPPGAPGGLTPTLSRDGSRMAWAPGTSSAPRPIYVRTMDQLEPRPLAGTEGALNAAFSPDGQWIAYTSFASGSATQIPLKKIPVAGGAALTLTDSASPILVDWGSDDNIYFTNATALLRIPSSGGKPQVLATVDPKKGEIQFLYPQLLPGGKEVLFSLLTTKGLASGQIVAINLQSGERKTLVEGSLMARYASTDAGRAWGKGPGYVIYGLNGALLAAPLELDGLKIGSPVPVIEGVAGIGPFAQFGFSDSGTLAYVPGSASDLAAENSTLVWVDRQGKEQAIQAPPRDYGAPKLSPDNQRIAADAFDFPRFLIDLWIYDRVRGTNPRITFEGNNQAPLWTPDGKRLIYASAHDITFQQSPELRSVSADGSGPPVTLLASEAPAYIPASVSPDGKLLMGTRAKAGAADPGPAAGNQIWVLPLDTVPADPKQAKPVAFLESQFSKSNPQFSPDGKSVAYESNDTGPNEIYVVPYPGPGGKQQVSTDGGTAPRWSVDGRELFYRNGDKMMAVDIQTTPVFKITGTPKMLFEKASHAYDVSKDGKQFLMLKQGAPQGQSNQIDVVVNWFEELRRRVPGAK